MSFDISRLCGGSFCVEYPHQDPNLTIKIHVNHPTNPLKQYLLAESGLADDLDENGKLVLSGGERLKAYESYKVMLAEHCISGAENLEGWPASCQAPSPSGWPVLSEEALTAIDPRVRRFVLCDVGAKIIEKSEVSEEEGNGSGLLPTGAISSTSTESPNPEPSPDGSPVASSATNETGGTESAQP